MGLKVVFVDHVARLSGAEIAMARLIRAADQVQATVILAEDGPLAPALTEAGAQVEVLPMAESTRGLTRAELQARRARIGATVEVARYAGRLRKRLVELKPDIVHTNSLKSGVYGTAAARLTGAPCVWCLQDHLTLEYLPSQVARTMRLIVSTAPSALVVPSQSTLRAVGPRRRPGLRVAVIPHPVPMPKEPATVASEVRVVGVVGRLTPWNGQHVFLDAFARAFPEPPVRARLVGSAMFGEEAYEIELGAQAQLGILLACTAVWSAVAAAQVSKRRATTSAHVSKRSHRKAKRRPTACLKAKTAKVHKRSARSHKPTKRTRSRSHRPVVKARAASCRRLAVRKTVKVTIKPTAHPARAAAPARAVTATPPSDGWNVLSNPIDPTQQTDLPFGERSQWLQPWRAYMDTQPASMLRNAVGINFDVPAQNAVATANLLSQSGFTRARLEIGWNQMSYADPSQLQNPGSIDTLLGALKSAGIRPLILLNVNDTIPGPSTTFTATVTQPAVAGATSIQVDPT
ncbi:MAG: glycosyltransferase, partial [Candidatus Dormibacter sp.]